MKARLLRKILDLENSHWLVVRTKNQTGGYNLNIGSYHPCEWVITIPIPENRPCLFSMQKETELRIRSHAQRANIYTTMHDRIMVECRLINVFRKLKNELFISDAFYDIIFGDDEIKNPLPLYSVDDNLNVIQHETDSYTFKDQLCGLTSKGDMFYFGETHFDTAEKAIVSKIGALEERIKDCQDYLREQFEATQRNMQYCDSSRENIRLLKEQLVKINLN